MSKHFYLGRLFDPGSKKTTETPLNYDPADLTTHAVVTGMTGSGKTGLCIGLLEEAALQGIPALLIDPKGDLTNLLLHFPDLAPQDFQPWIDPEVARRAGESPEQVAMETALQWRNGLTEWGIGRERMLALKNAAQYAVYTPGSDAGIPVSVLSSLEAPPLPWDANREILRERIGSTVTALLGLVGFDDIDPLRSREHILLANIFENAWSRGKNLSLTELILQTQSPPMPNLGAFPVETFFPSKDRMSLALQLNNILAAPAFETWRAGQPLDIQGLLFTPDGRPRQSVFYLAHLGDAERMFFVTLLLTAVETWMRTQAGATSLRALLYMDEIFGYLPPQSNPPSKTPMLRMLKQARAFGLGLILATQNPVDIDYKGLSNTGTWFIGKLQTERDKERLLDGLTSADGSLDRGAFGSLISGLGKRVFVVHNIHEKKPVLFQTRWAMNFLAGPLTRTQIPALNSLAGADWIKAAAAPAADPAPEAATSFEVPPAAPPDRGPAPVSVAVSAAPSTPGSQTRPKVPAGVGEYFLPTNQSLTEAFRQAGQAAPQDATLSGIFYRPALLATVQVRFLDRKYGVDSDALRAVLAPNPDRRGVIRWDDFPYRGPALDRLQSTPEPQSRFDLLDIPLSDAKQMSALQKDLADWAYRSVTVTARANETLKVYAGPDVSPAEFRKACSDAAREARDAELAKVTARYDSKLKTLQDRLAREERELRQDETELQQRKMEEMGTHAENVLSLFSRSRSTRRLSTSLSKRRMTEQAKEDVDESLDAIAQYKKEIAAIEAERDEAAREINDRWGVAVNDVSEITVTPKKTDVFVHLFGVAWLPHYLVESGGQTFELPAFGEG
ncbi:MAG: DUF87 domain-containing protein [Chloroflexota bacterium]